MRRFQLVPILSALLMLLAACARMPLAAQEEDESAIRKLFASYAEAIKGRDLPRIVACYTPRRNPPAGNGSGGNPRMDDALLARAQRDWGRTLQGTGTVLSSGGIVKVGLDGDQALVRWVFRFYLSEAPGHTRTLDSGVRDVLVEKVNGKWLVTDRSWSSRDIFYDIEETLRAYRNEARRTDPYVLQIVISQQGGVWMPVRAMTWQGAVLPPAEVGRGLDDHAFRGDLYEHFNDFYERGHPGYAHLFFQRGYTGWGFVGGVWHASPQVERELEVHSLNEEFVRRAREAVEGPFFSDGDAHLAMARVLTQQGYFLEAVQEFEKAEALEPRSVPPAELAEARRRMPDDPHARTQSVIDREARLGVPEDHPDRRLEQYARLPQSALSHTAMGLEASKWGRDQEAYRLWNSARTLRQRGVIGNVDLDAFEIMFSHLRRRLVLLELKPSTGLRSQRFFVRYQPGDRNILPMLAALEQAQEVVYSVFGRAMAGTEVILFPSQLEFARYREQAQGAPTSEYLQAETVTNVLTSRGDMYILSQEVITFPHAGTDMIKTVQHEYGHVAVNRLARGRFVPDWINEGIACVTEGGYPRALERCQKAQATASLIRMNELLALSNRQQPGQWTFAGERALLAYSQANLLIEHLIRTRGANRLLALLDLIGGGHDPTRAFLSVYGVNEAVVYDQWYQELTAAR